MPLRLRPYFAITNENLSRAKVNSYLRVIIMRALTRRHTRSPHAHPLRTYHPVLRPDRLQPDGLRPDRTGHAQRHGRQCLRFRTEDHRSAGEHQRDQPGGLAAEALRQLGAGTGRRRRHRCASRHRKDRRPEHQHPRPAQRVHTDPDRWPPAEHRRQRHSQWLQRNRHQLHAADVGHRAHRSDPWPDVYPVRLRCHGWCGEHHHQESRPRMGWLAERGPYLSGQPRLWRRQ